MQSFKSQLNVLFNNFFQQFLKSNIRSNFNIIALNSKNIGTFTLQYRSFLLNSLPNNFYIFRVNGTKHSLNY